MSGPVKFPMKWRISDRPDDKQRVGLAQITGRINMRVKRIAGVLVATAVLAFMHHSNAQEKIEISTSCLDDFLQLHWAAAYFDGFDVVWSRAYDMKEHMKDSIYDVETEDRYNGAIQITNDIIDLYEDDDIMQDIDRLFGRMEGKYNLPEGEVLYQLEQRLRNSDC